MGGGPCSRSGERSILLRGRHFRQTKSNADPHRHLTKSRSKDISTADPASGSSARHYETGWQGTGLLASSPATWRPLGAVGRAAAGSVLAGEGHFRARRMV